MATITSGETNNMITFQMALKYLDAKTFVDMATDGEIEQPESFDDVIKFIAKIGGIKIIKKLDNPDDAVGDVVESIKARLKLPANDRHKGWRYKSKIIDQLKRRKFFMAACKELKLDEQSMFLNALADMAGEIEHSEDGKQIRLKPEVSSAPSFTADCPDMDF